MGNITIIKRYYNTTYIGSYRYIIPMRQYIPDPEKLSNEPSATEVVMSLLLIGSVLTGKQKRRQDY